MKNRAKRDWYSTAIFVLALILGAATLALHFPWNAAVQAFIDPELPTDANSLVLGIASGAVASVALIVCVIIAGRFRKRRILLTGKRRINIENDPVLFSWASKLKELLGDNYDRTVFYLSGDPDRVQSTGKVKQRPRALRGLDGKQVVVIPALYRQKLDDNPPALAAVFFHEAAHFRHKDHLLLLGLSGLLSTAAIIMLLLTIGAAVSLVSSYEGTRWDAFKAALSAKAYLATTAALLLPCALYVRAQRARREALADEVAEDYCGRKAIEDADRAIGISEEEKPNRGPVLTVGALLMLGFMCGGASDVVRAAAKWMSTKFGVQHHFTIRTLLTRENVPVDEKVVKFLQPDIFSFDNFETFQSGGMLVIIFSAVLIGYSRRLNRDRCGWSCHVFKAGLMLILGATAFRLIGEIGPRALASAVMPFGFDAKDGYEPWPLIYSHTFKALTFHAHVASFAIAGSLIAVMLHSATVGMIPAIAWPLATTLESSYHPEKQGFVSIIVLLSVSGVLFLIGAILKIYQKRAKNLPPDAVPLTAAEISRSRATIVTACYALPIVSLVVVYWFGFGEVNHMSYCASRAMMNDCLRLKTEELDAAGTEKLVEQAMRHAELATSRAIAHATLWLQLSNVYQSFAERGLAKDIADLRQKCREASIKAAESFYKAKWNTMFIVFTSAGDQILEFDHSDGAKRKAADWYDKAEPLFRKHAGLDERAGRHVIFNRACLAMVMEKDERKACAYLLEYSFFNEERAVLDILRRPQDDLAEVELENQPDPDPAVQGRLSQLPQLSAPEILELCQAEGITTQQLRAILAARMELLDRKYPKRRQ